MSDGETVTALQRLGLTEYAARTYEALVHLGPSHAPRIAEAARIPRTKVYAVLDTLAETGWVQGDEHRPRTYRAMDPRHVIDDARAQWNATIEQTRDTLATIHQQEGVRFGGPLWVISGAHGIQQRATEMVTRATKEVFFLYAFQIDGDPAFLKALDRAAERGLRVRMLARDPELVPKNIRRRLKGEIRTGPAFMRNLFIDGRQALAVFLRTRDDGSTEPRALWNPHRELVEYVQDLSETMWAGAERM